MKAGFKIILPALIIFLFSPTQIFAKSGCCSSHGGVSCSAGPQANGNVICNDGRRGSSCSYSGMVECGGYSTQAPVYTTSPTQVPTIAPTIIPTVSPTQIPIPTLVTPSPTPTPSPTEPPTPIATPQIKGESTSAPTPEPITKPLTAGEKVTSFSILVLLLGIPVWVIWRKCKKRKNLD